MWGNIGLVFLSVKENLDFLHMAFSTWCFELIWLTEYFLNGTEYITKMISTFLVLASLRIMVWLSGQGINLVTIPLTGLQTLSELYLLSTDVVLLSQVATILFLLKFLPSGFGIHQGILPAFDF